MGAHPKERISPARRDRRRAHDFLTPIQLVACPSCQAMKRPHHVCPSCGQYKGRQIIKGSNEADNTRQRGR